jgi:SAM-dependent methyltransferase
MVLTETDREQLDTRPDAAFYSRPRFVTHVDEGFRARLTRLYADLLEPGDRVLDAMSSHVSHLPAEEYGYVVGHGLNPVELDANDRLDEWFTQDLNADRSLPLPDAAFDAVLCAVSIQYLQYPVAVLGEFGRILAPGGVLAVSFSNRLFPSKAIRAWREASMDERAGLVRDYVRAAGCFREPDTIRETPAEDPFYAVVARRESR